MRILITGVCGFAGSTIAAALRESMEGVEISGIDNFSRSGSELNRPKLANLGVKVVHGDIRSAGDVEACPDADWVIDAAANPSVLAGANGSVSSRQLMDHNVAGTINVLEYCKARRAGFILLSTSRVYSIPPLSVLPVEEHKDAFRLKPGAALPPGASPAGISETFSTAPPVSLYGASRLASEILALEYGNIFQFPVWINRCGVLAGAGQFGKADQGIFAFWINTHLRRRPLRFIGFGGRGFQVRDCLHPRDLIPLLRRQMNDPARNCARVQNVSGGANNSMSLAQLQNWCDARFGEHSVQGDATPRPFDVPWLILDSTQAEREWNWRASTPIEEVLAGIAAHAEKNPDWLEISGA